MKCLSEEKVQAYIDGELDVSEKESLKKHLATCETCQKAARNQRELSLSLKGTMNLFVDDYILVPEFRHQSEGGNLKVSKIRKLVYTFSAACILLLMIFVLKNDQKETTTRDFLHPVSESYIDANQPVTEQELVITAINPNGEVTEYIIE
jgi:hypothetical protein